MKKLVVLIGVALILATPMIAAAAGGIQGDCYGCHTMHNSEGGLPVATIGVGDSATITTTPVSNLLKYDCMACHAMDPGGPSIVPLPGGSLVPQVLHGGDDLASGNFSYGLDLGSGQVHNVKDLFADQPDNNVGWNNEPPGIYHSEDRGAFTSENGTPFDMFTCAGARGCHGTRNQVLTQTVDLSDNSVTSYTLRTGMAAITGAHHLNYDGKKEGLPYSGPPGSVVHDPQKIADGYRFLPGTHGFGNLDARWQNLDSSSHNEYLAVAGGFGPGDCGTCHITAVAPRVDSRLGTNSTIKVPNPGMSAFCGTCHSTFHSSGTDNEAIRGSYGGTDEGNAGEELATFGNGVSGAFLRHPSDYVIPAGYGLPTIYNVDAPVGRPNLNIFSDTTNTGGSSAATAGTDSVMCLSCHNAHGSQYEYLLKFDYSTMDAGGYDTIGEARAAGGCLHCHGAKGVAK